jgi:hypothetical protein
MGERLRGIGSSVPSLAAGEARPAGPGAAARPAYED